MEFTLLENGTDSFKKAKESLRLFEKEGEVPNISYLKDSIIYLNHSLEVLLKEILSKDNEYLIFGNMTKYIKVKAKLKEKSDKWLVENDPFVHSSNPYKSVFDITEGRSLNTIGLEEAIGRVQYCCDINIEDEFKGTIMYINDYRNKITHHSIKVETVTERKKLITELKFLLDSAFDFFKQHIPSFLEKVDLESYALAQLEWEEHQREMAEYYQERMMSNVFYFDPYADDE